ncbi:MAG: transporter substrate-binding domain-containing protein, partial [Thermodesulfobacteriota bacterium]
MRSGLASKLLGPLAAVVVFVVTGCSPATDGRGARDLEKIESSGVLKAIVRPRVLSFASPGLTQVLIDRKLAKALSEELGLKLKLVVMDDNAGMLEMLRRGDADVIVAGLIASPVEGIAFSVPYRYTDEVLILRETEAGESRGKSRGKTGGSVGEEQAGNPTPLRERPICLSQGSRRADFVKSLKRLGASDFIELPRGSGSDEALAKVESGECFGAAVDSVSWDELSDKYPTLLHDRTLAQSLPISIAMGAGAINLLSRTNEYLISRSLSSESKLKYKGDLDLIKKKKVLRMLTRNNSLTYYIYRGAPFGFEYEMMKKFADAQRLRLDVILPPGHDDLIPWLLDGRADIVASAMTLTGERKKQVAFTIPYNYVKEEVVVRGGDDSIKSLSDLVGKSIHVRKSSAFYETLMSFKEKGFDFDIVLLPEAMETEDILDGV